MVTGLVIGPANRRLEVLGAVVGLGLVPTARVWELMRLWAMSGE